MLHLFSDHKEMFAGDIAMEVVSWSSNLFRNNLIETRNWRITLFNKMKRQVENKYETLMKKSRGPKKDDELKKFVQEIYPFPFAREKKKEGLFHQGKRS